MRQLLLSLQLSILNYCVKKGGRKREGREEKGGEKRGKKRGEKRGREGRRRRERRQERRERRQERRERRQERRGRSEGGGSQEGREDIYSMRPHVWMPHSWVVSNILSVSDDGGTGGSWGVVYRGLTKPPSRI